MVATLIGALAAVAVTVVAIERAERRSRERMRERAAMRRLVDYMNLIPQRNNRPW